MLQECSPEALKLKKLKRALWSVLLFVGALVVIWRNVAVSRKGDDSLTTESAIDARDVVAAGKKINAITAQEGKKSAELIQAYAQVGTLLPEYEAATERFGDAVKKLPKSRYADKGMEFYEQFHKMGQVWKREVEVVNRMAGLPDENAKVAFWEKEYNPLADEENRLIENGKSLAGTFDATKPKN
jgi:hypothetical protein